MSIAPIAVSIGEPAGIGPDIILSAWLQRKSASLPLFVVIGDKSLLEARAATLGLGLELKLETVFAGNFDSLSSDALPIMQLSNGMKGTAGHSHSDDAYGVIEAIDTGVSLVRDGRAAALVTCPINKKALYDAGFSHPGHTEYLAELCGDGKTIRPVMMLAGPDLRTIPVTIHIPLSEVSQCLTTEMIIETGRIVADDLRQRFGIENPRLAVAGLNPHAGEEGSMGREDIDVIKPAIVALKSLGIDAVGPLPADTMFHANARKNYDVALCMYHDQALIPSKTLAFDEGVNVTLGLPIIRTSPDHGTAYDIAGTGKANPQSFMEALKMAAQMAEFANERD
ncbi:MAG: 4-hydroxythreonine-4-phosphate dehydrogenase PdxA [Hyphomicrobiales bacterium]|nr:MAG: 4-hydroxythreonine-4-phosphate dehydrogenase PdxA [Hyphomicrobiales bacterium]